MLRKIPHVPCTWQITTTMTGLGLPFWVHLYDIVIKSSKSSSTKPHEDSVSLTLFKFEMRCKYSMKNNSHFLFSGFGKVLFFLLFISLLTICMRNVILFSLPFVLKLIMIIVIIMLILSSVITLLSFCSSSSL